MLRELAVNWRLVGETRIEREDWEGARTAFQKSCDASAVLLRLAPANGLYHRDHAISHCNIGYVYERQPAPDEAAALREYQLALPAARRAAGLDPRWRNDRDRIEAAYARLGGS